jgi:hypothetical protein
MRAGRVLNISSNAMKKTKKIYYIPGLISLIGLPVLCCIYFFQNYKQDRVLTVTFASKYDQKKTEAYPHVFDTTFLSQPPSRRKYIDITLNGNKFDDEAKINFFRVRAREIVRNRDTDNGAHLIFGDGSKYGSFVKILNYFRIDSIPNYAPFENHLWVLYTQGSEIRYRERIKKINEEIKKQNDNRTMKTDLSFIDKLKYFKTLWPILIMLILLILFSIKRFKI